MKKRKHEELLWAIKIIAHDKFTWYYAIDIDTVGCFCTREDARRRASIFRENNPGHKTSVVKVKISEV